MTVTRARRSLLVAAVTTALAASLTPAAATPPGPESPTSSASSGSTSSTGPDGDRWRVVELGAGRYEVSWTSPRRLPLGGDRPTIEPDGAGAVEVAPTEVDADGRTLSTQVTSAEAPDPAELDVVLSGDRLDEPGDDLADAVASAGDTPGEAPDDAPAPRELLDAPDPGEPGRFATTTSDYELDPVKLPGMREPIEMVGHVVEPAADAPTGPRPLVLFLHGRHEVCYQPDDPGDYTDVWPCPAPFEEIPSHLGYDYAQRLLASQGYATVSVRVNGINAQDFRLADGGADARARIVRRHLDHWVDLAPAHDVDLDRVVLVGHSRGGEGVDRAAIQIPLDAPYRVVGQVLIAPTDFAVHTAPYVPTVTVLPGCDGDVSDLQGQRFTDTGRDLADDDTALKSSVTVTGANHNFFNTEWTPRTAVAPAHDDWYGGADEPCGRRAPERLGPAEQRAVGVAYIAAATALFTDPEGAGAAYLPLVDGSAVTVASIGDADVRSAAIGGGRDERRPGLEATPSLAAGARTGLCRGVATSQRADYGVCGNGLGDGIVVPHWKTAGEGEPERAFFAMRWSRPGAVGGLRFDDPLDLSTDRLELRTLVDPRVGAVRLRVRLSDSAGHSVVVTPRGGEQVAPFLDVPGATKILGQTLIVDAPGPDDLGPDDLDPADVVQVELLGDGPRGRLWVADLAAAPARLAALPDVRAPQVSLRSLRLPEGDAPRDRVARVGLDVVGEITRPARIAVLTAGRERGSLQRMTIDLAPGQRSGTIPVAYTADRLDDLGAVTRLVAWPVRNVATDAYISTLRVLDDDPTPRTSLRVDRRVAEGQEATIRVRLAAAVDYDLDVSARVVRTPGRDVSADDVTARWREQHGIASDADLSAPLWRFVPRVAGRVAVGSRWLELTVPIARDGRREGSERLGLRIRVGRGTYERRVVVRPSR